MRALILLAGAALAISGCSANETAQNSTNADAELGTQAITANDTTSIDAASGEDANMAAETRIMPPEDGNESNATDNSAVDGGDAQPAENPD